jgi:hypothetical protein
VDIASGRLKAATSEYTNRVLQQQWLAILGSIAWDRGDTMEHSDELRDLTKRLYEAEATGDLAIIERHFSRQEGAVYIGSDPNEWWEGFEAFVDAMRAQSDAIGGMQLRTTPVLRAPPILSNAAPPFWALSPLACRDQNMWWVLSGRG